MLPFIHLGGSVMVFNATFNNTYVISCRPVLLVEKTSFPEKITDLPHNDVSSTPRHERDSNSNR
jgi:hypothetical protein